MNKSYILAIGILSTLISCQGVKKGTSWAKSIIWDTIVRVDTLRFLPKDPAKREISPYPILEVNIQYIYPQNHDTLRRIITENFLGKEFVDLSGKEAINKLMSGFTIDDYPSFEEVEGTAYQDLEMYDRRQIKSVSFVGDDILSIEVEYNSYTGGHDMNYRKLYSLALNSMIQIKNEDIFIENSLERLSKAIQTKLIQQYNVEKLEDLELFFCPEKIEPNDNFIVTTTGIRYCYNPLEVAARGVGIIQVDLTWDEISHIIRPGSIIEKYI